MSSPLDGNGVCKRCRGSGDINPVATCPDCDGTGRTPASSHTAVEPVALAYSGECIDIAREAFDAWASKPHNKRWFKRIDGTPIINDIIVNMAVTFGAHGVIAKRAPSDLMVPLSALTAQAAALEAAEREAATLKARIAELEAGLEPFAKAAADIDDHVPDRSEMWDHPASMQVTAGDFRHARRLTHQEKNNG